MNLLPKSHQDFSQKEYWNTFFKKRGKKAFEWYGEYPELCEQLTKYIKPKDDILMIGCGNSNLSMDLYDIGYRNLTNIDISQVVIRQMQETNKIDRSDMKFLHMDALNMTFDNETFSVILDKGTLDALMPDDKPETLKQIDKLFAEINRVLKTGGRYVCVSLLQEHILRHLLSYFPKFNFMFRVVRCHEAEKKTAENGEMAMPVFVIVCTKFKQLPQLILETCMAGDKMQRLNSTNEVISTITSIQQAALVCSGLNKNNIADQDEISLDLYQPGQNSPRFTIYILDQPFERKNGQYAAFIVPQGRETEWLFSTKQGRKKLLKSANFNRLAIVTMHRGQKYESLEAVKLELAENVRNLAPAGLKQTIPYLSLGSDVGKREIRFEGNSEFSGKFVVEDLVGDDNQTFRRLIFLQNQNIVQSEAKLKSVKTRGNKRKQIVDPGYLACQHHIYMCIGAQLVCSEQVGNNKIKQKNISQVGNTANSEQENLSQVGNTVRLKCTQSRLLVIGLGGGGLCTFLHNCLPDTNITAVDIDENMLKVATEWFGLIQNDKLTVKIQDGLKFLEEASEKGTTYNAILFDVDSKDATLGMSCPPKQFLEPKVLENVKKCIKGIFILNLVLRDETLRSAIIDTLKSKFKIISSYKLEEDLNEILFCSNMNISDKESWTKKIKMAAEKMNEIVKKRKLQNDEFVDVNSLMDSLKIYE